MASKRYDRTKVSIYPDHSTISAAFKAHRDQDDAADYVDYLPLRDWFERVAREANLCLSTTHVMELVGWKDHDTADAMARWYDALPIVWTRAVHNDVDEFESDHWTKIASGVEVEMDEKPFAASLLSAFHSISPEGVAALLAQPEPALAMVT